MHGLRFIYAGRFALLQKAILAIIFLLSSSAWSESSDHLSMGMLTATKKLSDTHTLFFGGGTLVENFKGDIATIGVVGKVSKAVGWQAAYFHYSPTLTGEERHYDHRLRGALTYRYELGDWRLFHRSRVEYRRGDVLDGFRYRPAFQLSHPLDIAGIKFRPFVEYEPFYDARKHSHTLSLYTAGTAFSVFKRLKVTMAYFKIHNYEDGAHTDGPMVTVNISL